MSNVSLRQKVIEIDEVKDQVCNSWEHSFITSMMKKCDRGYFDDNSFSPKERKKIEDLYEKACDSPY